MSGTYQYQSDFAKKYFSKGMAEGRASALLHVLRARNVATTDEQRQKILACSDAALVERWLERAVIVTSAEELFDEESASSESQR